ncbi:uncharacterized protein LOC129262547 [Lytechinus pictus]|uniref:uncharacterized protein LOC129262547 n=1 Tax=Lytechinus pictus TaxID=7653 RepID=UPI0030B9C26A
MTNSNNDIDTASGSVKAENETVFEAVKHESSADTCAEDVDTEKTTDTIQEKQKELTRVVLWTAPRSMSTAFERCMTMIPNTKILNEMYAAAFLLGPNRKMRWWPKLAPTHSYKHCKERFEADYSTYDFVFAKDFPLELYKRPDMLPKGYQHTFLIRNPVKVFKSLRATLCSSFVIRTLSFGAKIKRCFATDGYFFQDMWELYSYLRDHPDYPVPIIMDADDIVDDPEGMIRKYCEIIGIPFNPDILKWEKATLKDLPWEGPRFFHIANWMVGCYKNALNSTGFLRGGRRKNKVSSEGTSNKSSRDTSAGAAKPAEEAADDGQEQTVNDTHNGASIGIESEAIANGISVQQQGGPVKVHETSPLVGAAVQEDPFEPDLTGLHSDVRRAITFTMPFYRKLYEQRIVLDKVVRI